jgi:hypothetical protein
MLSLISSLPIPPAPARQPDHLPSLHLHAPAQLKPRSRQPPQKNLFRNRFPPQTTEDPQEDLGAMNERARNRHVPLEFGKCDY